LSAARKKAAFLSMHMFLGSRAPVVLQGLIRHAVSPRKVIMGRTQHDYGFCLPQLLLEDPLAERKAGRWTHTLPTFLVAPSNFLSLP
jgi:hypothetical protein